MLGAAAVMRCGNRIEKLPHFYFSWIVSFQNRGQMRDIPSGKKRIRSKLTPAPLSNLHGGGFYSKYHTVRFKARRTPDRWIDGETRGRAGGRTDIQDRQTYKKEVETDLPTDDRTYKETDSQTYKQKDRKKQEALTHKQHHNKFPVDNIKFVNLYFDTTFI